MKVAILDILLHKNRQVDLHRTVCGRGNRNIRDEILQNAARHNILTYFKSISNQRNRNQYVIYSTVRKINRYKPSALRLPMLIRHCKGTPLIRTSKPPNLPKQRFPRPRLPFPEGTIFKYFVAPAPSCTFGSVAKTVCQQFQISKSRTKIVQVGAGKIILSPTINILPFMTR